MKTNATVTTLNHRRGLHLWAMAAAFLFLALASTGRAQYTTNVIYVDLFGRTGPLNATTPDTVDNWYTNASAAAGYYTNANANASWWADDVPSANHVLNTDGSEIAYTNLNNGSAPFFNAYLPFNPVAGHKYIFSISIDTAPFESGGNNWLATGFANGSLTNNYYLTDGQAWLLQRANETDCQYFYGTANMGTLPISNVQSTNRYQIICDATTGTAASGWTFSWYANGVLQFTKVASPNPTINYVGVGGDNAQGYFQNLTLTDIIAPSSIPVISEPPQNAAVSVGQTATFWVNASGNPSPVYQWYTNGLTGATNAITSATSAVYTTPATTPFYNNLQYRVVIANFAGSVTSTPATLSVANTGAKVFSAVKAYDGITNNLTNIVVTFSKPVSPTTALNAANYTLNNSATVMAVSNYGSTSNAVLLMTSILSTNASYNLTVANVQDFFGNAMTSATVPVLPAGLAIYLRGDSGVILDNSGNVAEWIDQTTNGNNTFQNIVGGPTARPAASTLGGKPALSFNGVTESNYLTAASTASLAITNNMTIYTVANFTDFNANREILSKSKGNIASPYDYYANTLGQEVLGRGEGQNQGTFPSGNGAPTTPCVIAANMSGVTNGGVVGVGTVTHYLDGQPNGSGTLTVASPSYILDSGTPFYVGGRNDQAQWMNGQMAEIMVFSEALSAPDMTNVDNYLGQKYFTFTFTSNLVATTTSSNGFTVTYSVQGNQGSAHFSYQWQVNGTNIPGANSQFYTTPTLGPANSNTTYDVVLTLYNGSTVTSATNTLTVLPAPPYVNSAGIPLWEATSPTNIIVIFNEAVDPVTGTVPGNYLLNNGATVHSAAIGDAPNKVVLTTTAPLTPWNANPGNYSVTVQNVQDPFGDTIVTASTPVTLYPLGTALWVEANNGVVIDNNGSYVGVSQWNDQSGNGANLAQQYGAPYEPQFTTNYHGNPTLQFSGTNVSGNNSTYMWSFNNGNYDYPCLEITNDMSIFAVVSFASSAGLGTNGEIVSKTGTTSPNIAAPYDCYANNSGQAQIYRGNGTNYGFFGATNNVAAIGVPHIVGMTEAGNTVSQYFDAAPAGTGALTLNGNSYNESSDIDQGEPLWIGERADTHNRLNGDLSELILISQAVDSNDLVSIENYLAAKYDVPTGANSYPIITQQPVAVTNVYEHTTLTVPTGVTGNPLALQWYSTNGAAISGQTSATLSIPNILATNSYYLVATNIYGGSVTSSVVLVNVIPINNIATNIVFGMTNNQLTLTWPADHTGWQLQAQTNKVSVGLSTNWANYNPSTGTNQVVIPVNLTNGTVFYRLMFP